MVVSFLAEAALLGLLTMLLEASSRCSRFLGCVPSQRMGAISAALILGIPFLGLAVGIVAGALPAYAATKVQPLELPAITAQRRRAVPGSPDLPEHRP